MEKVMKKWASIVVTTAMVMTVAVPVFAEETVVNLDKNQGVNYTQQEVLTNNNFEEATVLNVITGDKARALGPSWNQTYTNQVDVKKQLLISWGNIEDRPEGSVTIRIKNTGNLPFRCNILDGDPALGSHTITTTLIQPGVTRAYSIDASEFTICNMSNNRTYAQIVVYCTEANGNPISFTGEAIWHEN